MTSTTAASAGARRSRRTRRRSRRPSTSRRRSRAGMCWPASVDGPAVEADYQLQVYYDRTNRDEHAGRRVSRYGRTSTSRTRCDGRATRSRWAPATASPPAASRPSRRARSIRRRGPTASTPRSRRTRSRSCRTAGASPSARRSSTTTTAASRRSRACGCSGRRTTSTTLWGAVTRAVRTPSRVETDYTTTSLVTTTPIPTFVRLVPESGLRVGGPRGVPSSDTACIRRSGCSSTASGFYNRLRRTRSAPSC